MVRMTLRGGDTYTGKSLDSIIRREFGDRTHFRPNLDPNSPESGVVLTACVAGGFSVEAVVLSIEGEA